MSFVIIIPKESLVYKIQLLVFAGKFTANLQCKFMVSFGRNNVQNVFFVINYK